MKTSSTLTRHKITLIPVVTSCIAALSFLLLLAACRDVSDIPSEPSTIPSTELNPSTPDNIKEQTVLIIGSVLDEKGPVAGAIVRIQTTDYSTTSDRHGKFALAVPQEISDSAVNLTAWAKGYFCGGPVVVEPGDKHVDIHLHAHATKDNPNYSWLPSQIHPGEGENQGCAECHSAVNTEFNFTLPVDEWLQDAHSQTTRNPRFFSMYAGTDLDGNQSPATRYGSNRDYGRFPLRPDPDQPYFGPGYKLDFPKTAGNCAACHSPAASVNQPYNIDPRQVSGVASEGIPCDFCHKIWEVRLNPETGLPSVNMPGVLSFEFLRPPEEHQFFAGPFDDVAPGEDTFSELQTQSQICAPCHFGIFWDTLVYNSFGEWLESPYSEPESGKTCQNCHMPPLNVSFFARPEKGGLERHPESIFSHRMPGAADIQLLENAVKMEVNTKFNGDHLAVSVSITNDQTGHHVPTDSPLRQLILVVEVSDGQGQNLELLHGPIIPEYGGIGDPSGGYYAGLPGKIFAKVLEELWTEISPSGAYWNPTRVIKDNRLAAFQTDTSTYSFAPSKKGEIKIEVRLLFRRAFIELMDQKGWNMPDILMESESIQLTLE